MEIEITTSEAARRLGVSSERVGQMLRSGELRGRQLDDRNTWLVSLASVQDRARVDVGRGRPWADHTVASVIAALSDGSQVDAKTHQRLRNTSVEQLWRKIAQAVTVRRYRTRNTEIARPHLALTGESAIDRIGEKLVGESRVLHGYLREIDLEDLIDDAGLVEDGDGNLAIHELRASEPKWAHGSHAPRALIAVDCAREPSARVRSAGLRALEDMRMHWLGQNT